MSENKIRDISNVYGSTIIIGDNNQAANIKIDDLYLEAKELKEFYKEEQKTKKQKLNKLLTISLFLCGFILFISMVCYFFSSKESLLTIWGFIVSVFGTGFSIYAYFDNLNKPNQTQRDYDVRYKNIIRILNYHRRQDLVSELDRI